MATTATTYRLIRPPVAPVVAPRLDPAQQAVVDHDRGPLLVLAGPGTGKTTTLVEAVVERVRRGARPDQVLVLTFSRKAADELRERIAVRLGRTTEEPAAYTFHSFALSLLRSYGLRPGQELPRLLSGAEREVRIRELMAGNAEGLGTTRWPASLRPALRMRGFAREVADLLDRSRERDIDAERLRALGEANDLPAWVAGADFMAEYLDVLSIRGEIDYAGLVSSARDLLDGHASEVVTAYSAVYVDEYQDTDPVQTEILKRLAGGGRLLVAVGDPDQSIYGFRGADTRAILEFRDRFPDARGEPARLVALDTCRRSGPELVALSRAVAKGITTGVVPRAGNAHRALIAAGSAASAAPEIRLYSTAAAEAAGIGDLLRRAHLMDGVPWSQMAVLVRSGVRSIPSLRRALVIAGVPVSVAADELPLSRDPAVAPLLLALRLIARLNQSPRPDDALSVDEARALILSPLAGGSPTQLRALGRRLRGMDRIDGRDLPRPSGELLRDVVLNPAYLELAGHDWSTGPVRRLTQVLETARSIANEGGAPDEVLWALWDGSGWARRLSAQVNAADATGRAAERDLDAVIALFDAASRLTDRQPRATVGALLEEIDAQEIPAAPAEERGAAADTVRLLTAHRSKGLEWDLVVVAGVQENVWPDLRRRGSLLGADLLSADGPAPPPTARELLIDERRLFYVAVTRARRRLVLTATAGLDDMSERPSQLLAETGLTVPDDVQDTTHRLDVTSLVASLRRTAQAADAPPASRSAAAHHLATLAGARGSDGVPLVPTADPTNWWGMREETDNPEPVRRPDLPVALSGSSVAGFERCPRAFFLEREVKAKDTTTSSQGFGSVVHALAEAVATGALPASAGVMVSRLAEVWHGLGFEAPWQRDRDFAEAREVLERFLTWHQANPREFVAAERDFEVSLTPDIVLRGRADRLELDEEGRLVVVDLKTGKYPPADKDLGSEPQLGVYQLAVRQGGFPEGSTPGGAELVQLRKQTRGKVKVQPQPALDDSTWADELVTGVATAMRNEAFPARPHDGCDRCPFRTSCPGHDAGAQVVP